MVVDFLRLFERSTGRQRYIGVTIGWGRHSRKRNYSLRLIWRQPSPVRRWGVFKTEQPSGDPTVILSTCDRDLRLGPLAISHCTRKLP